MVARGTLYALVVCSLVSQALCSGATYYVSATGGNDANPGTIDKPLKTIQEAAGLASPGDTCIIRQGTYRETVTPARSGSASAGITYKAYPGEAVTVSGADPVMSGWSSHSGSIYKSTAMTWSLGVGKDQVFVNGGAMMEARWPNTADVMLPQFVNLDSGSFVDAGSGGISRATLNDAELNQPSGYWVGAVVHATWSPRYHAITGTVTSSTPGTLQVDLHIRPYPFAYGQGSRSISSGVCYLTGTYKALDQAGEWFYDAGARTLYLWAPGGVNPASRQVEAKRRMYAFDLRGKSYIRVEGMKVFSSTIITDGSCHHIALDNLTAEYVSHYTLIDSDTMSTGSKGVSDTGIILAGSENVLSNSRIAHSAGNGVTLLGSNNEVRNCEIHSVNYVATECAAVHTGNVRTVGNRIIGNRLYRTGRSIVMHSKAENLKILHNEMFDNRCGNEVWDCGVTYVNGTDTLGTEIAYNRIHDFRDMGIYLDNYTDNARVHHNVVWNGSAQAPMAIHMNTPSRGNLIYHNTLGNCWLTYNPNFQPSDMTGTIVRNNVGDWVTRGQWQYGTGPGMIIEKNLNTRVSLGSPDPALVYVNYGAADYRLRAGSPAIDAGLNLGFTQDIDGNPIVGAPDQGAYEYTPDAQE